MAHYFADALEARLAGTGIELYAAFAMRTITAADILKAFQVYVTALSNIFAGESIGMLTREATSIHIIDFGILYGFQWPCFIQGISLRPSGPPILRITGIDFPQPGFRPAERVEETGRQLAKYCRRFNVPFEYNAIAKKWDSIQLNDLKINKSEMLVVNCLYRLIYVPDETASENSPRDDVLRLIKQIKPDVFLHGIINGTHNSSFFETRFKEALFHYSSLFDMMEATVPRENQERLLFEKVNFGKEIMNIVAWEGTARVERPEPYKQWQLRN
ncbi:scarecrow-like protein 14 [Capsicum chacoense]